jgi:transposase-like protein
MTSTWITATRQRWKLSIFWLILLIGLLLAVGSFQTLNENRELNRILDDWSVAVLIISFVWLFVSIRCPKCGRRPTWWIVRHADLREWYVMLSVMRDCPICHDQNVSPETPLNADSR